MRKEKAEKRREHQKVLKQTQNNKDKNGSAEQGRKTTIYQHQLKQISVEIEFYINGSRAATGKKP